MNAEQARIPVGISSCLLGERVRYDGGQGFWRSLYLIDPKSNIVE